MRNTAAYFRWCTIQPTLPVYFSRKESKLLLNHRKKAPRGPFWMPLSSAFSKRPQRAGVSVSATKAEMATEMVIVTANCLYRTPVMPPTKATGIKMDASTAVVAIIGPCTSCIAFSVASLAGSPSLAMCSSTFSITTMASSTTRPMASTMAKRVSVLMVKSRTMKLAKVPTMETGTASTGIRVVRHFWRKINTTRITRSRDSMNVSRTSLIDALMKFVLSMMME